MTVLKERNSNGANIFCSCSEGKAKPRTFGAEEKTSDFQVHIEEEMNCKKENFDLLRNIFALNLHFHKYPL